MFWEVFYGKRMQALPLFLKKIHVNRCEHFWTDVNTCWQMQTKLNNCKRMQQNVRPWFPMNLPLIHHPFWWGCWTSHDISHGHLQSGSKAPSTAFLGFHWLHHDRWSLYQACVASWSRKWLKSSPESADEGHALVTQMPNQHNMARLQQLWCHNFTTTGLGAFPSWIDPTGDSPNKHWFPTSNRLSAARLCVIFRKKKEHAQVAWKTTVAGWLHKEKRTKTWWVATMHIFILLTFCIWIGARFPGHFSLYQSLGYPFRQLPTVSKHLLVEVQ